MNTIFVHRDGRTEQVTSIDRSWLSPSGGAYVWVDLAQPSIPEALVLTDTFAFHKLAVDDGLRQAPSPKIEAYDGYLFASLAADDAEVACFVGPHYLVTVHWRESKTIADLADSISHGGKAFADGPVAMFHRIADGAAASLQPALDRATSCVDGLEKRMLDKSNAQLIAGILDARRDVFVLMQRLSRQREALDRLVRRDIVEISTEMAFRFRDVRDRLIRLSDAALALDHRLAGVLTGAAALAGRRWM